MSSADKSYDSKDDKLFQSSHSNADEIPPKLPHRPTISPIMLHMKALDQSYPLDFKEIKSEIPLSPTETFGVKIEYPTVNSIETDESSLICKTEYFVQESKPTILEDQVSDYCPTIERSSEVKTENHVNNEWSLTEAQLGSFRKDSTVQQQQLILTSSITDMSESILDKPNITSHTQTTSDSRFDLQDPLSACQPAQLSKISLSLSNTFMPGSKGGHPTKYKRIVDPSGKLLYTCHITGCGKIFICTRNLKRHLDLHQGEKNFLCTHCGRAFARKDSLSCHIKRHENIKKNKNEDAEAAQIKKGSNLSLLKKNALASTPDMSNSTPSTSLTFTGVEDVFLAPEHEPLLKDSTFIPGAKKAKGRQTTNCKCPNCSVVGGNKTRGLDGKLQHNCHMPDCGRVFRYPSELEIHLNKHIIEKNFVCEHCNRDFTRKDSLVRHVKRLDNVEINKKDSPDATYISKDGRLPVLKTDLLESTLNKLNSMPSTSSASKSLEDLPPGSQSAHVFKDSPSLAITFGSEKLKGRWATNCKCPNCSVQGGNKTRGPNGKLQHNCHMRDCGRVFRSPSELKIHLDVHRIEKKFICTPCKEEFAHSVVAVKIAKDEGPSSLVMKTFENALGKPNSIPTPTLDFNTPLGEPDPLPASQIEPERSKKRKDTTCQCPNCSADGGNTKKDAKGRLLHACHYSGCRKVYIQIRHLKKHLDWHSGKEEFFCSHCDKGFVGKRSLIFHLRIHVMTNYQRRCQCPNCSIDGGNKIRSPDGKLRHVCHIPHCGKSYILVRHLKNHLNWHAGYKTKFFCAHCDQAFFGKLLLMRHIKNHKNDEKNGTKCAKASQIVEDKQAATSTEIIFEDTIENVRPQLVCSMEDCEMIYYSERDLNKHMRSDHDVKPYECWCGKEYDIFSTFQKHSQAHDRRDLDCPYCTKKFTNTYHFDRHVYWRHKYNKSR